MRQFAVFTALSLFVAIMSIKGQTDKNGLYYMRARYYNTDIKEMGIKVVNSLKELEGVLK